jgi:hypothetical protein
LDVFVLYKTEYFQSIQINIIIMKKIALILSTMCFVFMVSCCGGGEQQDGQCCDKDKKECCDKDKKCPCQEGKCDKENCPCTKGGCCMTEEQKAECQAFKEKWEKFDTLTPAEQAELIAKKKECFDKKRESMKAKIAECDAKWAEYDKLTTPAEQKAFLDQMSCCKKKPCDGDKKCDKDGEGKKCDKPADADAQK